MWQQTLVSWASDRNMEIRGQKENKIEIVCPRKPPKEDLLQIAEVLPEGVRIHLIEEMKQSTMHSLAAISGSAGVVVGAPTGINGRHFSLYMVGHPGLAEQRDFWDMVNDILNQDGFLDSWAVYLNRKEVININKVLETEISKNTEDGHIIQKDDVLNLRIQLGKIETIDELLAAI